MASKLKWSLLSLLTVVVLAVLSMIGSAASNPGDKKEPPAVAPAH